MIETKKTNRPIRSYVRREGRMTKAQESAMERLWAQFGLELSDNPLDFQEIFGRSASNNLEIGFGSGEALIAIALQNPEKNYLGIDVHRPGVGALLLIIEKLKLSNIRIFCADAIEVLTRIPNDSLEKVYLFFPDPWPKLRHHKRRIVNENFVSLIRNKLKINGEFSLATDWENYAEHMMKIMSQSVEFKNAFGIENFALRAPERPITKFEKRGHSLGHQVWDLLFIRES